MSLPPPGFFFAPKFRPVTDVQYRRGPAAMEADNRARCPDILTFGFLLFRPHSDKQKCETKNAGGSEHKAQMIFQSNELSKQLIVENCTERAHDIYMMPLVDLRRPPRIQFF